MSKVCQETERQSVRKEKQRDSVRNIVGKERVKKKKKDRISEIYFFQRVRARMRGNDIYSIAGSCVMGREIVHQTQSCYTGEADEAK